MSRIFWMIGLSIAVLVFGFFTFGPIGYTIVRHRPVHVVALLRIGLNGYVTWVTFWYLVQKVSRHKACSESGSVSLPKL